MAKQIKKGQEARQALIDGINAVADPVISTMGPKGRNVGLDTPWGEPSIIHDGVTVAKDITLKDPFENMGAKLIKGTAESTNDKAGDGTTTSTLLVKAIANQGSKFVLAGASPMQLRDGINKASELVLDQLKKIARPVKSRDEVLQVAKISAQNEKIGEAITEALDKVGDEGIVTVEEGNTPDILVSHTEGMEWDKGYFSGYFSTDAEKMELSMKNPYILITDKRLSTQADILPFLQAFAGLGYKDLVIIADTIEGEALGFLIINQVKKAMNIAAIKAPAMGDKQKAMLEDIAALTGGKFISSEAGDKLDGVEVDGICGRADIVEAGADFARIIGGKGEGEILDARVEIIKAGIESVESEFAKEQLKERLAKLKSGVAVINVGASSEAALKELKERVKDAVSATQAAREEGLVAGGGIALLRAREVITDYLKTNPDIDNDIRFGMQMVYNALEQPVLQILRNAQEPAEVIAYQILQSKNVNYGYDIMSKTFGDMYKSGVIDPVKVTRLALEHAASTAGMVVTTEYLIADEPAPLPRE